MVNINRRTYGYTEKNKKSRLEVEQGDVKQESTNQKKGGRLVANNSKFWLILVYILVFPFKIIWFLFSYIWNKMPKLSQKSKKNIWAKLGWAVLTLTIFVFLAGTILVAWASHNLPDPDKLTDRKIEQSTKIYDRTGEHILYEVFSDKKRTLVNLDQIPKNLINGVIATEDTKFYEHKGIRPFSILRSIIEGIFTSKRIGSGASTLTQQLVKNAILNTEERYTRKPKEIILTIRLEQKYTKDQILKIYFNEIPYGSTNYGAEAAAQSYFGKHVSELNLQECATLAGFPQAPSKFLNNKEALKNRRDFVLERMFQEGYISRQDADNAQAEPITLQKKYGEIKAPHFVLYVKEQLVDKFGEQSVDTGGLRVITSLDWDKQQIAEEIVSSSAKNLEASNANNASLVALDPKTGQILSMVGSLDFYNKDIDGQFNVATLGKRQPGSSFKPIIYSALFERGFTPDTILWDVKRNFAASGQSYEPQDYDGKERGPVTIRQSLQGSLNIPAVEALYLLGPKNGVDFAGRMGYTTLSEGEFGLALVLGGGEVKLLEHTNAFGVFANNGVKYNPVSILRVEDASGDILYEWKTTSGEKVLEKKITDTISNVLSDDSARAYVFGAGSVLTLKDRPVAAKTGTTNDYKDAWTVGYTPSLVTGVWVGNTNNKVMKKGDGGSRLAAPIWNKFMTEALKNSPVEQFPPLPPNDSNKPILHGITGGSITLNINQTNGKIATSTTPAQYIVQKTYVPAHSILYYLDKNNPEGPPLVNPAEDPQYSIWEDAIQDWIRRQKEANPDWSVSFEDPPTQYDDGVVGEIPNLEIVSPVSGSVLDSRKMIVNIQASSPRGITKANYKIDEKYVGVVKESPFGLDYYASGLIDGDHVLTVIVEDDIGTQMQKQVNFTLKAGVELPSLYWASSFEKVNQINFPKTFFLNFYQLDKIAEASVYKQSTNGVKTFLGNVDLAGSYNNQLSFKWSELPDRGSWELLVQVKLKDGAVYEMPKMTVDVE